MGIIQTYYLSNSELFGKWSAKIEDWGSLWYVYIYKPNGDLYCSFPCGSLRSAKIQVTKEFNKKGAKYIIRKVNLELKLHRLDKLVTNMQRC